MMKTFYRHGKLFLTKVFVLSTLFLGILLHIIYFNSEIYINDEGILIESFYLIPLGYIFYLVAFVSFLILASKSFTKLSRKIFTNLSTVDSLKRTAKK